MAGGSVQIGSQLLVSQALAVGLLRRERCDEVRSPDEPRFKPSALALLGRRSTVTKPIGASGPTVGNCKKYQ